jgi:hypothetical protein
MAQVVLREPHIDSGGLFLLGFFFLPVAILGGFFWRVRDPMRLPIVRAILERPNQVTEIFFTSVRPGKVTIPMLVVELGEEHHELKLWGHNGGREAPIARRLALGFPKAWRA